VVVCVVVGPGVVAGGTEPAAEDELVLDEVLGAELEPEPWTAPPPAAGWTVPLPAADWTAPAPAAGCTGEEPAGWEPPLELVGAAGAGAVVTGALATGAGVLEVMRSPGMM